MACEQIHGHVRCTHTHVYICTLYACTCAARHVFAQVLFPIDAASPDGARFRKRASLFGSHRLIPAMPACGPFRSAVKQRRRAHNGFLLVSPK
jgi:hypothetical protein